MWNYALLTKLKLLNLNTKWSESPVIWLCYFILFYSLYPFCLLPSFIWPISHYTHHKYLSIWLSSNLKKTKIHSNPFSIYKNNKNDSTKNIGKSFSLKYFCLSKKSQILLSPAARSLRLLFGFSKFAETALFYFSLLWQYVAKLLTLSNWVCRQGVCSRDVFHIFEPHLDFSVFWRSFLFIAFGSCQHFHKCCFSSGLFRSVSYIIFSLQAFYTQQKWTCFNHFYFSSYRDFGLSKMNYLR